MEPRNRTRRWTLITATIALMLSALTAGTATAGHGGSSSPELDVVGHLSAAEMGVFFENITDVWAYGDHAYLGSFQDVICSRDMTGIHIVDIADPTDPTKVAFVPSPPSTRANDVKVAHLSTPYFEGEIMVFSNEPCSSPYLPKFQSNGLAVIPGQGGVAIYDVSDPTAPRSLKRNYLDFPVHNTYIYQQGDQAYMLVVDDVNERDVHIVDITKPWSPKHLAAVGAPDWPDLEVIENGNAFVHDVWAQENDGRMIGYISYWDGGLVLLDITDPANPVFLGDSVYQDPDPLSGEKPEGNSHVAVPTADGELVIMGDEDFSPSYIDTFTFTFDSTTEDIVGVEGSFTKPISALPGQQLSGPVYFIEPGGDGLGCDGDPFMAAPSADAIALIQRGVCRFDEKAQNAIDAGYAGFVVYNSAAGGESLVLMSGDSRDIPGVFVRRSDGLLMKDHPGGGAFVHVTFDGWGYMRVLDVTDTNDMVELGQFATEDVFTNPPPPGDQTAHNVIVRDDLAYWSWYAEGMRVVDFSGCEAGGDENSCTPTEVAHFVDTVNGSNFWGVYLHDHPDGNTYILGSDRATGLWIFEDVAP